MAAPRDCRAPTSSVTTGASYGRVVATTTSGTSRTLSATYSSTPRVSGSAQCRSSTSSSAPGPSSAEASRSIPSPTSITDDPPSSGAVPSCGASRPRAGRYGANRRSSGTEPVRSHASSASPSGRIGIGAAERTARPARTAMPASSASASTVAARRDLPTPGSPRSTHTPP
nr:hypothetical protein [Nocardioides immobilis]